MDTEDVDLPSQGREGRTAHVVETERTLQRRSANAHFDFEGNRDEEAGLRLPTKTLRRRSANAQLQSERGFTAQEVVELALATATPEAELDLDSRVQEQEELELLDQLLWPLLPHFQAEAATLVEGQLAYGTFVGVYQTVQSHVLVYLLQYEDGDVHYLAEAEAAAAELLAAAARTHLSANERP